MPGQHARLSPSAASRWLACPASIRVAAKVPPQPSSPYAHEGTLAHALAEIEARHYFGQIDEETYEREYEAWRVGSDLSPESIGEMREHVESYIELIEERRALYPMSQVMFEQRMDTGVEACWGTSDTVIVSPEHVEIIDFKYGAGVPVSAEGNPQLRLYGLGALDTFGDVLGDTKVVRCTVHQPRLNSISTEELTVDELREWRSSTVAPAADIALHDEDAPFGPSETACRWCPAAGECVARIEKLAGDDFADGVDDPDVASAEQLADAFGRVKELRAFCDDVEAATLRRAYSEGEALPGLKVVLSRGRRVIGNSEGAVERLSSAGYGPDSTTTTKLKGLGELEKLVGKKELPDILGELLQKVPGKPAVVPESDARSSISPNTEAQKEFSS